MCSTGMWKTKKKMWASPVPIMKMFLNCTAGVQKRKEKSVSSGLVDSSVTTNKYGEKLEICCMCLCCEEKRVHDWMRRRQTDRQTDREQNK
mmetsp:Transcript_23287/g.34494  ORF Transcript_23287/g.34494 Transcript_23287/m.34494 type:complete len:91 (+) Transcript_23287:432-704(+)